MFNGKKVLVGLSGGINSMAVLCWLGTLPEEQKPDEVHLFYADFKEHSPDTLEFVLAGWNWAINKFKKVNYTQTENSVMDYFEDNDFIPHPTNAKCSVELKIEPMLKYAYSEEIQIDLVGYVAKEVNRMRKNMKNKPQDLFFKKEFPIIGKDDEWCFEIVLREIGWYPKIYDILDEKGNRVFKHNNCLPCKNMTTKQMADVKKYYPDYYQRAMQVEENTGKYFGRGDGDSGCAICKF